jgi:hypothetical protein
MPGTSFKTAGHAFAVKYLEELLPSAEILTAT